MNNLTIFITLLALLIFQGASAKEACFLFINGGGLTLCHHAVIGSEWRPRINRLKQLRPVPRVGRRPSFIQADPHLAALTVEARFQHLDHAP